MIVKILGYKISLEIIILLLVIYLVMMVHTLAGCCNPHAISEGLKNIKPKIKKNSKNIYKNVKKVVGKSSSKSTSTKGSKSKKNRSGGKPFQCKTSCF